MVFFLGGLTVCNVSREQFIWCSGAVYYTRSAKCYTSSKMHSSFYHKISYYNLSLRLNSSKLKFFATQNFESKLFPECKVYLLLPQSETY